uniref:Uncharacterized protein n=1 Tax=Zea mays TaxID=4577 RepID=A0A804N468_MAIZE
MPCLSRTAKTTAPRLVPAKREEPRRRSVQPRRLHVSLRRQSAWRLRGVVETRALVITPRASLVGKEPKLMACMRNSNRILARTERL